MLRNGLLIRRYFSSTRVQWTKAPVKMSPQMMGVKQAPNEEGTWSESQQSRQLAMNGPRFEQMDLSAQPQPLAARELIARQPVIKVQGRVAVCDGGGGPLGHPKVFINLDRDTETGTCGYCGLQFQQQHGHH